MEVQAIIFVVVVSLIILSISFIYISVYLGALLREDKILFFVFSIIYGIDLILLIVSYLRAVCTTPGYTDPDTKNKLTDDQLQLYKDNAERQNIRKKQRGQNRSGQDLTQISQLKETAFCQKCKAVKPPRAHHCKLCKKCILRMDHHCPWVGNCVGKRNNKYFILFLFYSTLGLLFTWITLCIDSFQDWRYIRAVWVEEEIQSLMTIIIIFSIMLSLSIGSLFVTQILGLVRNITTLESFIPNIEGNSPFDLKNWRLNFKQILGNSYWLLPTAPDLQEQPIAEQEKPTDPDLQENHM